MCAGSCRLCPWPLCTLAESIFSLIPLGAADGGVSLSALGVLGRDARVGRDPRAWILHPRDRIFFSITFNLGCIILPALV